MEISLRLMSVHIERQQNRDIPINYKLSLGLQSNTNSVHLKKGQNILHQPLRLGIKIDEEKTVALYERTSKNNQYYLVFKEELNGRQIASKSMFNNLWVNYKHSKPVKLFNDEEKTYVTLLFQVQYDPRKIYTGVLKQKQLFTPCKDQLINDLSGKTTVRDIQQRSKPKQSEQKSVLQILRKNCCSGEECCKDSQDKEQIEFMVLHRQQLESKDLGTPHYSVDERIRSLF